VNPQLQEFARQGRGAGSSSVANLGPAVPPTDIENMVSHSSLRNFLTTRGRKKEEGGS